MTKRDRLTLIREITESGDIRNQKDLLDALARRKVRVDQSTLSRDLSLLNVRKRGGRYAVQKNPISSDRIDLSPAVEGWVPCGPHLIVVHTTTGQAQAVAFAIDQKNDPAVAGTLAGDDTLFVATRNRQQQAVAVRRMAQWFGEER